MDRHRSQAVINLSIIFIVRRARWEDVADLSRNDGLLVLQASVQWTNSFSDISSHCYLSLGVCASCVLVAKSCLTLYNPMDYKPPGSSVHGVLQARTREWVAISFSRDLPDSRIKPGSPPLEADSLPSEPPGELFIYLLGGSIITNHDHLGMAGLGLQSSCGPLNPWCSGLPSL